MRTLKHAFVALVALATGACSTTYELARDITQDGLDEFSVPARAPDLVALRGVYLASAVAFYGADSVRRYSGGDAVGDARALAANIRATHDELRERQRQVCSGDEYDELEYLQYIDRYFVPMVEQAIKPAKRYWSNSLTGLIGGDAIAGVRTALEAVRRLAEIEVYKQAITHAAQRHFDEIVNVRLSAVSIATDIADACKFRAAQRAGTVDAVADQISADMKDPPWYAKIPTPLFDRMCQTSPTQALSPSERARIRAFLVLRAPKTAGQLNAENFKVPEKMMIESCQLLSGAAGVADVCGIRPASWITPCGR